jgi:5'-nucleotidase
MRILISNDDGINAPGLKVLERIARTLTDDVWVFAPEIEHSGAGHSLTLMRPLRLRKVSRHRFAVDGTPTDCMAIALKQILQDNPPDLMLSGVNHGANLGEDVTYSGTIAAAMEATLLGIPSIAISMQIKSTQPPKWGTAEHYIPPIIKKLLKAKWPKDVLINLNVPNVVKDSVKGVALVKHGMRHEKGDITIWNDPRGEAFYWLASSTRGERTDEIDTDLYQISDGYITLTPLHLDLTHYETLNKLKKVFG